jgi:hypothetical protein
LTPRLGDGFLHTLPLRSLPCTSITVTTKRRSCS